MSQVLRCAWDACYSISVSLFHIYPETPLPQDEDLCRGTGTLNLLPGLGAPTPPVPVRLFLVVPSILWLFQLHISSRPLTHSFAYCFQLFTMIQKAPQGSELSGPLQVLNFAKMTPPTSRYVNHQIHRVFWSWAEKPAQISVPHNIL